MYKVVAYISPLYNPKSLCHQGRFYVCDLQWLLISGSKGTCPVHRPPPQGSRFFHFDRQNFQNVTTSGVNLPHLRGRCLPYGKSWIGHYFCIENTENETTMQKGIFLQKTQLDYRQNCYV